MTQLTWNRYPKRKPDPRRADNWEDDPERIAHQTRMAACDPPQNWSGQQKLHHGVTGKGAFLRRIVKSVQA